MSLWDIVLPHRLLVNRSLRKESAVLRSHIDEYKMEYELEVERCSAKIEQARDEKNRDFENVKLSLIDELSKDKDLFDKVNTELFEYLDLFLRRQCLYKIQEAKRLEKQALEEYSNFLTAQMSLIGKEIDMLEVRKDKMVAQANVDDIRNLIGLTGCDLTVDNNDDAFSLLAKVSELATACELSDRLTKQALQKLRSVLQERVELFSVIQYISWTIQQKKQLSRQLANDRRRITDDIKEKSNELLEMGGRIKDLSCSLDEQARIVRGFWAIPIANLSVQISFYEIKLKSLFSTVNDRQAKLINFFTELKDTNQQIQQMINLHSDDNWKWERLQREKSNYQDSIASTKTDIDILQGQISQIKSMLASLKTERQQWFVRQQMLYSLCKKNNVYLIPDGKGEESDEYRIIDNRLVGILQIEKEANQREEERFERESARILQLKMAKINELSVLIKSAEVSQSEKNVFLSQASKQLSKSKSSDTRFILIKVFSETEEVNRAKQTLKIATSQKKKADDLLLELKAKLAMVSENLEKQLNACRPKSYRLTSAEIEEREKLEGRRIELLKTQRQNRTTRKEGRNDV